MRTTWPLRSAPWAALVLLLAVLGTVLAGPAAQADAKVAPVVFRGCSAVAGAKALGSYYADAYVRVYACGARPAWDGANTDSGPAVLPYAGSMTYYRGFQCIELVARYLKARFNADAGYANGAQAVDRYARAYPSTFRTIANGTKRRAPRKGDVLSLSRSSIFNDVGHTGIVISSVGRRCGQRLGAGGGAELGRRRRYPRLPPLRSEALACAVHPDAVHQVAARSLSPAA